MRKNMLILGGVTVASLVAALLGHAYCREFCIATKPMAWPFVALVIILIRSLKTKGKENEGKK